MATSYSRLARGVTVSCVLQVSGGGEAVGARTSIMGLGFFLFSSLQQPAEGDWPAGGVSRRVSGVFFSHTVSLHIKEKPPPVHTGSFRAQRVKFCGNACRHMLEGQQLFSNGGFFHEILLFFYLSNVGLDRDWEKAFWAACLDGTRDFGGGQKDGKISCIPHVGLSVSICTCE